MRRALEFAQLGRGLTLPNPQVGAVLVRGGKVIGEGHHQRAGTPHAEVQAVGGCQKERLRARGRNALRHPGTLLHSRSHSALH